LFSFLIFFFFVISKDTHGHKKREFEREEDLPRESFSDSEPWEVQENSLLRQLTWAERIKGEKSDPFFFFFYSAANWEIQERTFLLLLKEEVLLFWAMKQWVYLLFFVQQRGEVLLVLQKIAESMSCCNKTENREEKRRKNIWFMLLNWEEKLEKEQESFLLAETERIRRNEKMWVKGRVVPLNI